MDAMEQSSVKGKIINVVILVIALIVAINLYQRQMKNLAVLQEKKLLEEKKNEVLGEIEVLQREVVKYKTILGRRGTGGVMSIVSGLAQGVGLSMVSFRPGVEQQSTDYSLTPFYLELNAPDYHAVGRFINKLETFQDVYIVENVAIRPNQQTEPQSLSATIRFVAVSSTN